MTTNTDALVSELRVRAAAYEDRLAGRAADTIDRLTRERDEARDDYLRRHNECVDMYERAIKAEAERDRARAELAECRNKALEEAVTLVSGTAHALSPHILLAPDETKAALVEATVVALNSICDGIRSLKTEA